MGGLVHVIKNEPVVIVGFVQAILGLVLAFGVDLSNEQVGTIMAATAALLAMLARMFVSPTSSIPKPAEPPVVEA